jgi:hypothetical protein
MTNDSASSAPLMQDIDAKLSQALASTPGARRLADEAAQAIASSAPTPDALRLAQVAQALEASVEWMMHGRRNGSPVLAVPDMVDAAKFIRAALAAPQAVPQTQAQAEPVAVAQESARWSDARLRGIASDYFPDPIDWRAAMLCMRHLLMEQGCATPSASTPDPLTMWGDWTLLPHNATEPMQKAMAVAVLLRKSMNDVWRAGLSEAPDAPFPAPAVQPLTDAQIKRGWSERSVHPHVDVRFLDGVRFAERAHGISAASTAAAPTKE